ncbi:MAG: hypothetical protein UU81_C0026G0014 [Microgenomates group bacterium GW2011_GWC1_41_8]|uniref:Phosphoribosyltransferase domain-containing protein n=3 Tax=Candidatus Roizmaniibacteriota TaxID=1752723 RepID=A0A0G0ZB55_9BACT|nr:MAG: hypothetical protein UU41_C0008G0016 [Candidatus Roizmanbacteria bacterium GW2011_GWA1_41_13]KKS19291.1 MAG: hypothetical protein UU78_C0089G0006 [Candidatus Roizmanbacteria bacterium GW2011_GWC2_41_7]KKS23543.1 MAG: hypothetical protein UU81_C0026G0014 [Microgenomates group bacterium GW2011_GWC1_41_8]
MVGEFYIELIFTSQPAGFFYGGIMKEKPIIYDASEYPFPVLPEVSDLGDCPSLAEKLIVNFPQLTFSRAVLADGNILIQDLSPLLPETPNADLLALAKSLNMFSTRTLHVVDGQEATSRMLNVLNARANDLKDSLVLYPLGAGRIVKNYIEKALDANVTNCVLDFLRDGIELPVTRISTGTGKFSVAIGNSANLPEKPPKKAFIVDDVIASGQTAYAIAAEIKKRYGPIPCNIAAWILVDPPDYSGSSGVLLNDCSFAGYVVKGNLMQRPPINSLSCFVREEPRDIAVKQKYVQNYMYRPEEFKTVIQQLRKGSNGK